MSLLPSMLDELEKTKKEITQLRGQLSLLYAKEKQLIKNIQEQCSHPSEYIEQLWINGRNIDPLEARIYQDVCRACGKSFERYTMVNGQRKIIPAPTRFDSLYN